MLEIRFVSCRFTNWSHNSSEGNECETETRSKKTIPFLYASIHVKIEDESEKKAAQTRTHRRSTWVIV